MRASLRAFLLLSLAALGGCGSSSVSLSNVDESFAKALCDQIAHCPQGGGVNATVQRLLAQNPGTVSCTDALVQSGAVDLGAFEASVDAGRIKYDGEAAQTCLDALEKTCIDPTSSRGSAISSSCDRVWQGQVALGGSCTIDEDCAGAARCDTPGGDCTGTCVALVPIGGACGGSDECDPNVPNGYATCSGSTANPADHCIAVKITSGVQGGGGCGLVNQTDETWEYAYCASGLYCRRGGGGGGANGVCAIPIALGQACTNADVCDGNAACASNPGGAPGSSCQIVTLQSSAGQLCDNDTLTFCNPLNRLACDDGTGACVLVGTGAAGQPCRRDFATDCDTGLYCDETANTAYDGACAAKLTDGAACDPTVPEACQSGYCDFRTNPPAPVCSAVMCGG